MSLVGDVYMYRVLELQAVQMAKTSATRAYPRFSTHTYSSHWQRSGYLIRSLRICLCKSSRTATPVIVSLRE